MGLDISADIEHRAALAFASDVAKHRLIVRLDQGLHRHLVFEQREHAWNGRFELLTAPGSLTITGDHGSHTFRRQRDMFQFFRNNGHRHRINPGYWAEKLPDAGRSVKVYDECVVKAQIEDALADWPENRPAGSTKSADEIRALITEHEQWGLGLHDESSARHLLSDLEVIGLVSDTWEWDLTGWDFHFLWCLHAIAWGVRQYDAAVSAGLHVARPGPVPWGTPLPTAAPTAPARRPGETPTAVRTVAVAGGVL